MYNNFFHYPLFKIIKNPAVKTMIAIINPKNFEIQYTPKRSLSLYFFIVNKRLSGNIRKELNKNNKQIY